MDVETRYRVASFGDSGTILDLDSGTFSRLNRTGVLLGEALARGSSLASAATLLERDYGIDRTVAERDAREFLEGLTHCCAPAKPVNAVTFSKGPGGDVLRVSGRPILSVDFEARTLTPDSERPAGLAADLALRWAAPHLLWAAGVPVLHASAVNLFRQGGSVVAFPGASGAGKTTLARALVAGGALPVSEDVLVLDGALEVVASGEQLVNDWVSSAVPEFERGRTIPWGNLPAQAQTGARRPLGSLAFPERSATVRDLEPVPLSLVEGLELLLVGSFAERASRELWASVFEVAVRLVRSVRVQSLRVPEGLDRLSAAAGRYSLTTMS